MTQADGSGATKDATNAAAATDATGATNATAATTNVTTATSEAVARTTDATAVARTITTNETAATNELVTRTITKSATTATNTTVEHVSECIVEQSVNVLVPQISGPNVEEVELFSWVQPRTVEQIVDAPVVMRVQDPVIQKVQKTVRDPRVTYIDRIGDSPVVLRRREAATVKNQKMSDVSGTQQDDYATSSMASAIQGRETRLRH